MPSDASHNPKVHLNLAGDKPEDPRVLGVTVKQSKTDPLRKGIDLFLGIRCHQTCSNVELPGGEGSQRGASLHFQGWTLSYETASRIRHVREVLESVGED